MTQHDCPGIGQGPLLVESSAGVVMVEVPTHIDETSVALVAETRSPRPLRRVG